MEEQALVKNVADEEQVNKAKGKVKLAQAQDAADLKYVMQSRQGRNVLWRVLGMCQMGDVGYDDHAMRMSKKAGMRTVGAQLSIAIEAADFDGYQKMQREARETAKERVK